LAITVSPNFSVSPLPRVIRIEPSSACNLSCIHCPTGTRKGSKRGIMPGPVFQRIIRELKHCKNADVAVLYHGGEPFLNKNIFSMIRLLKSTGVRFVKMVTNGMLINEGMLNELICSGLDSIEFSLDGNSPQENDRIRKGSDFGKVASIVKKLLMKKRVVSAKLPEVFIACTQIPYEKSIRGLMHINTPEYLKEEFADFRGEIGFKNTYMIKWPGFRCGKEFTLCGQPESSQSKHLNYCNHVVETTTIRYNGDVVPCCYDITGSYTIGNIMREPLEKLWNNARYRRLRKAIARRAFPGLCRQCNVVIPQLYVARKGGKLK
jgi:radical SAM protein with 4Fe4S-binding SPASM domain